MPRSSFAPVGDLVPLALKAVRKGGRVVCAGIHMSDIPSFPYRLLWEERQLVSVANLTRMTDSIFCAWPQQWASSPRRRPTRSRRPIKPLPICATANSTAARFVCHEHDAKAPVCLVKLAPSILAADFARLGEQLIEVERAGADRIHVDVMDGHFVPNLSMGAPIVQSLRRVTRLPLEIHMMVEDPDIFLQEFVDAGSDSFLVHWEGNWNLHRTVQRIKALGKKAGVAINPATPATVLEEILQDVDQVLVMTVNPGFGHQPFIHTTLPKIRRVRRMIDEGKPGCERRSMAASTTPRLLAIAVGANVLVAGSSIFCNRLGVTAAMKRLRTIPIPERMAE